MTRIIPGRNPVEEALAAELPLDKIFLRADLAGKPAFSHLLALARRHGVTVLPVPAARLDAIAGGLNHRGVLAMAAARDYADLDQILARAKPPTDPPFILLLDQVQDPHNLGALARSAESAGVHGLVLPKRRSAGLTDSVITVAAGALEHLPVAQVVNLVRCLETLKEHGLWVVGAAPEATSNMWEADLSGPLALVLGAEGRGLGRLVKEHCDLLVSIPQRGKVRSLNVAAAGAVLMFEILRQRSGAMRPAIDTKAL